MVVAAATDGSGDLVGVDDGAQMKAALMRFPVKFKLAWEGGSDTANANANAANRRVTVIARLRYVKIT